MVRTTPIEAPHDEELASLEEPAMEQTTPQLPSGIKACLESSGRGAE
jgi:hypothetical protein